VQPGEFIKEDTPVITLVQMDPLKVITAAQEKFAGVIQPGMPIQFTVESYPNEMFRGRIVSVSPAVDQSTRTFTVEAELPNPDHRLKPGFFAKGAILTRVDSSVIAAPEDAISTLRRRVDRVHRRQWNNSSPERDDWRPQGNLVEIVDGLHGDETLATSNLNQLLRRRGSHCAPEHAMIISRVSVRAPCLRDHDLGGDHRRWLVFISSARSRSDAEDRRADRQRAGAAAWRSAEEVETQLTKPLEEAVNTINGIDELRASSDPGRANLNISFVLERDIESATQDVRDKIGAAARYFPKDTLPPVITKADPDAAPCSRSSSPDRGRRKSSRPSSTSR
jgi:hypothetical protein